MKDICILIITMLIYNISFSQVVDEQLARKVAENHFNQILPDSLRQKRLGVNSIFTPGIRIKVKAKDSFVKNFKGHPSYYVISMEGGGFEVVAAYKANGPILLYSETGNFNTTNAPKVFWDWMAQYDTVIDNSFKKNKIDTIKLTKWQNLENDTIVNSSLKSASYTPGNYLVQTMWDQTYPYNTQVPSATANCDPTYNGHCPAGCVAIALSQIVNYWGYGQGNQANFEYWNMPNDLRLSVQTQVDATAYMIERLGNVFLQSNYCENCGCSCTSECSTSAYAIEPTWPLCGWDAADCISSLKYLGYFDMLIDSHYCWHYTYNEWVDLLKSDIDAGLPIIYTYIGEHTFICDGYEDTHTFHFNMGWNGFSSVWSDYEDLKGPKVNNNDYSNTFWHECITGILPFIPDNNTINNLTYNSGDNWTWQVGNTLTVQNITFASGSTGQLVAGSCVDLQPGFWAKPGSNVVTKAYLKAPLGGSSKSARIVENEVNSKQTATKLNAQTKNKYVLFPNPSSGIINLEFSNLIPTNNSYYVVYGISGNIVAGNRILSKKNIIDLSNVSNGIYIFKIMYNNQLFIQKVIKQ